MQTSTSRAKGTLSENRLHNIKFQWNSFFKFIKKIKKMYKNIKNYSKALQTLVNSSDSNNALRLTNIKTFFSNFIQANWTCMNEIQLWNKRRILLDGKKYNKKFTSGNEHFKHTLTKLNWIKRNILVIMSNFQNWLINRTLSAIPMII